MYRKSLLRESGATLLDAIRVLDASANGLVLVVDEDERLRGVISDGDVRRGLLAGMSLGDSISRVVNRNCMTVPLGTSRAQVLDIMTARRIGQVPILDGEGRVVGIHLLNRLVARETLPNAAIVMAGGKGTRLGDLTKAVPKPMLKVAGRPILERIVLHLVGHGVTHVYLAVNHLKDVIIDYFGDGSRLGCRIEYLEEEIPLGSGGPLSLLPEQEHPIVVMNGDLITDANISRMLEFHRQNGYYATMGFSSYEHTIPFGCIEVENGAITQIQEKPTVLKRTNAGIYVLSPEAVRSVPKGRYFMITEVFARGLEQGKPCGAYPIDGDWIDVGQPQDLGRARGEAV